ncbi:MAG: flagellar hook-associated protein FlgK [Bryobacteraceae bacterium]|jgi:flagellar hook-associated protein 1 FlgK
MGNLLSSLNLASNAMDVIEQAVGVVQNNVTNASTPGYVLQTPTMVASPFDPQTGVTGGVQFGPVQSARNQFAEEAVRYQNSLLGTATQAASSLDSLQQNFDVSGTSGIPAALSNLYSAFSSWSATSTDSSAQQQVITAAQQVAQAFNDTASSVSQLAAATHQQLQSTVTQINQLSGEIQKINVQIRNGGSGDAGLDAQLNTDLESLSNLTSINVQYQSDGTVDVLMGGQTPLVMGATQNQLSVGFTTPANAANPDAPPAAAITTADGQDVTGTVSQGTLAGLLTFSNTTLAGILGDAQNAGSLNQLAQAFANQVNSLVTPASGIPLFTTSGGATSAAQTLAVNPNMTAAQLVASSSASSNGTADQLAQLGSATDPTLGMGYTDFYANIASDIGTQESTAAASQTTQQDLLSQAQNTRSQVSGISLNQEAAQLIQFQQAYEASAQTVTTINNMLTALLDMTNGVA